MWRRLSGNAECGFAKWQALTSRIRKMVEEHEEYAPEAFKSSILELMPEYVRAANAAVARLSNHGANQER
jgi:hypothetical protein